MITLITPKLKDEFLIDLLSTESMSFTRDVSECAEKFNTSKYIVKAIYDQFEEMGLLKQERFLGGGIYIQLTAKSHDFYSHGGFTAQEELLKANIQKLSSELDLLAKQLSPNLPEKAASIASIGASIATALGLFKS